MRFIEEMWFTVTICIQIILVPHFAVRSRPVRPAKGRWRSWQLWWTETMASLRSEMIRTILVVLLSWFQTVHNDTNMLAFHFLCWDLNILRNFSNFTLFVFVERLAEPSFLDRFPGVPPCSTALRLGRYQPRRDPPPWQETALPLVEISGLRSLAILDPRRW